ncbi:MAG TPA: phosphoadenosine phosphosulfate reductase family protein [Blastocatellia bacterium]|nr:phosphoadenosine phosphosulfate reductase family protein [Blastocatellia bacterium]HMZ19879.1 phosphoadenosine phosphosulfate reductase family protein [Blastocatellia bacterium]
MTEKVRHILSLSGGKDSAALAIYMRDRVSEMEYIFHDTEKELPETYEYLSRLEAFLGKKIHHTKPDYSFDKWYDIYGEIIPSGYRRWCTRMLKLKPFEAYVGDDAVINYVGIRADEEREGYISHKSNIKAVFPFREDGLVKADIIRILEDSGLGLPTFTQWGRTRSGCFFCFYQQKIEWVRLKEKHPDLYEDAKQYEKPNKINGNVFFWSGDESLEAIEQPGRMAEIKRNWEKTVEQRRKNSNKLVHILTDLEDETEEREGCLICQL